MSLEEVVANLVQKVEQRYYGKYRGFVVDNADPEHLGRLKVTVPSLLGPDVVTGWAMPCAPYGGSPDQGFLFIPDVGAGVWVEFEGGDLEFPIWAGTFWSKPEGKSELPGRVDKDGKSQESMQDPPTRKIIKTRMGHTIQLEDADREDGEERIIISDGNSENRITFGKSGVVISNRDNSISLTDQGIILHEANSNKLTLRTSGIVIEDKNGNKITFDNASGGVPETPGITINGEKRVCLEGLINWLMGHTHMGNMGAPCPLNPADLAKIASVLSVPQGDILSKRVKLG